MLFAKIQNENSNKNIRLSVYSANSLLQESLFL